MRNKKTLTVLILALLLSLSACDAGKNEGVFIMGDVGIDKILTQISLDDYLNSADVSGELKEVWFISNDGLCSKVTDDNVEGISVDYNSDYKWHISAPNHPASTEIKDLEKIVIVCDNSETGLLIDGERSSLGEIMTGELINIPVSQGASEAGKKSSEVIKYQQGFDVDDGALVLITNKDEKFLVEGSNGHFILNNDSINFLESDGETYENIKEVQTRK